MTTLLTVQQELSELRLRIDFLEKSVREIAMRDVSGDDDLDQALALTKRLFPGDVKVIERDDPEIDGHRYFVLEVEADGSVDAIVELNRRWHEELARVEQLAGGRFTLFIIPKD